VGGVLVLHCRVVLVRRITRTGDVLVALVAGVLGGLWPALPVFVSGLFVSGVLVPVLAVLLAVFAHHGTSAPSALRINAT